MVEFALGSAGLFTGGFRGDGTVTFFLVYSSVYTASREATRYGASVGFSADGITPHDHDCAGIQQVAFTQGRFAGITNVTVQIQNLNEEVSPFIKRCLVEIKPEWVTESWFR